METSLRPAVVAVKVEASLRAAVVQDRRLAVVQEHNHHGAGMPLDSGAAKAEFMRLRLPHRVKPAGSGGQQPSINRTPSFSRPNLGRQRGVTTLRPSRLVPAGQDRDNSGIRTAMDIRQPPRRSGLRAMLVSERNAPLWPTNRGSSTGPSSATRSISTTATSMSAHSSYQPAYYRHSGYHGYWNGNRGFGGSGFGIRLGSSLGYGLGSNLGYGGGYGPGWGWGLGSGYGYGAVWRLWWLWLSPVRLGIGRLGTRIADTTTAAIWGTRIRTTSVLGSSGYNYSQPIPVLYNASVAVAENDPNSADEVLNNAVAAFQQNDYDAALDITNKGIAQYPDDAVLHEFRALVLFARQDYQQSAATIHSVLAVGPGWDWTTLSSMYSNVAIYTEQLRALEAFTKANPQDAASRFLLAYHYMSCGHPDAAARHLQQVVKLMPNDRVAADVLKMVSAPQAGQPGETAQPTTPPTSTRTDAAGCQADRSGTLVGTWKAARADGSKFNLTLTNDAKFTWSFAQKDQAAQAFGGTYSVEGNVLALERKDGGSLIAEVTPGGDAKFNFKLLGAPADDPGLDFNR